MAQITKAIIPVAGWGTRRLPITKAIEKCMLPIGNRPIVDYIVEDCARAGITDIYFVINDTPHSQLKDYYGHNTQFEKYLTEKNSTEKLKLLDTAPANVNFHYSVQPGGKYGTAVPLALAIKEFGLDEQVLWCNGDDPFWNVPSGSAAKDLIDSIQNADESAVMTVTKPREEMPKYGMIVVGDDGLVTDLIEKPTYENAISNHANINRYVFSPKLLNMIIEYVDTFDVSQNERGEYEATDPIGDYIRASLPMRHLAATGEWLDSGNLEGWLYANEVVAKSGRI
ncbi:UTP--glucose-1-phosphate uridylyltransferase [Alphaproteobacteria bacterium]|nr:UTP--glucose-1-phosphate uridylyltransferase [Alphaproteobacteria bacterium]